MRRSEKRILTTHTGSLPRPAELVDLYVRRSRGETVDPQEMKIAQADAVRRVVAKQVEVGIDVGNDGEQQRDQFFSYVRDRVGGFGDTWRRRSPADIARYPLFKQQMEKRLASQEVVSTLDPPRNIAEVRYLGREAVDEECGVFKSSLHGPGAGLVEAFLTAPSPGLLSLAMRNDHYDNDDAYLDALSAAMKNEYEAIVEQGFVLQVDGPDLAMERHITYQDEPLSRFLGFVERSVDAINRALAAIPRDRVRVHVCWGQYEGPHDCDVPMAEVFPIVRRLNVGAFVMPMANPRHAHEIKTLKRMPIAEDQIIVAGVIDTTTNIVEHPEVVAGRIEAVARATGDPSRVMAGTDCGFDTGVGMGRVTGDVAWAKLKALSDGASLASQRLFQAGSTKNVYARGGSQKD